MAIEEIEVDTQELNRDIEIVEQEIKMAQQSIYNLFLAIEEIDTIWEGEAKERFNSKIVEDCQMLNELCNQIEDLIDCMMFAQKEYKKCEENIVDAVNMIK